MWDALEHTGMKTHISQLDLKLDAGVESGGCNFSFGQRQLLILTRALLAKPKILIMDEATASVDSDTDEKIQNIVKTLFKDTTVVSIAHRLNTIADYDRVVVLDQGQVLECDHPWMLLQNAESAFSNLVAASGSSSAEAIHDLAKEGYLKLNS